MTQRRLFETPMVGPAAVAASGYRETPAEPIDLLCSLPAFRALSGPIVDLGVGGGALYQGIQKRMPSGAGHATRWSLVDSRAVQDFKTTTDVRFFLVDAAKPWPALLRKWIERYVWKEAHPRVVSNPPWSVLRCPRCDRQWRARAKKAPGEPQPTTGANCPDCKVPGVDLAIAMIAQTMRELPNADIWVLHLVTWPFHNDERSKFWNKPPTPDAPGQWAPPTHRWAGEHKIAKRVAYAHPARGQVQPHNVMSVWYHWVPIARYTGFTSRVHRWPLPNA